MRQTTSWTNSRHLTPRIWARRLVSLILILALGVPPGTTLAVPPAQMTELPTETPTPALEASASPTTDAVTTATVAMTETATPDVSAAATETPTATPDASKTATETATLPPAPTASLPGPSQASPLEFSFTVSPGQAGPGEEVKFTAAITNAGKVEAVNVVLENTLPSDFSEVKGGFDGFVFDPQTRIIRSTATDAKGLILPPGETVTLQYTARLNGTAEEGKILDTAMVTADGLAELWVSEAILVVAPANEKLSDVKPEGGNASGLNGQVQVEVPEGALTEGRVIVIEELSASSPPLPAETATALAVTATAAAPASPTTTVETATSDPATSPAPTATGTDTPTAAETATQDISPAPSETPAPATSETPLPAAPELSPTDTTAPATLAAETATPLSVPSETATPEPALVVASATAVPDTATVAAIAAPAQGPASPTEAWLSFKVEMFAEEETALSTTLIGEADKRVELQPVEAVFAQPVELTVRFGEMFDLSKLDGFYEPYIVTLDEASGVWVQVPAKAIDTQSSTVTVETAHFSTWGAGLGEAFPNNGANIFLFDSAMPDLFTGRSHYSIPIWTPPGRGGLAPQLALSYSSGRVDGVLGDIQAPWVGMGWSVDSVEITRKITNGYCQPCGNSSYGYKDEYVLTFNSSGGELIAAGGGRYRAKDENFLYIQRHNVSLGNQQWNGQTPPNASDEWWEVVTKDGIRWRLGFNADSEQLAAMAGYPGNNTGAWASLGYGGAAVDRVAARWRADRVTDRYSNTMNFSYSEETRQVAGSAYNYDRASYLDLVTYTGHSSGSPAAAYSVEFVRETRPAGEEAGDVSPTYDWDNWDTKRLDKIEVQQGALATSPVVRTYDLAYTALTNTGATWKTTVLSSVTVSGGGLTMPAVTFTYVDKQARGQCTGSCAAYYPRLETIDNGWGGTATYTYGHDGRSTIYWYNWHVDRIDVSGGALDGGGALLNPKIITTYLYGQPCYNDDTNSQGTGWCNGDLKGGLVGYSDVTVSMRDNSDPVNWPDKVTTTTLHKFYTDEMHAGSEYEQYNIGAGTLSRTTFAVLTADMPVTTATPVARVHLTVPTVNDSYIMQDGQLKSVGRTETEYDITTGNVLAVKQFEAPAPLMLFADGFETNNFNAWDTVVTGGGISTSSGVKLVDKFGMQAGVGSTTLKYVQDETPSLEAQYRARFWFDPNTATIPSGGTTLLEGRNGAAVQFKLEAQKSGSIYQVRAQIRNDGSSWTATAWQTIADAPHALEVEWASAANAGYLKLWVDGSLKQVLAGVDNDQLKIEEVRLGAMNTPSGGSGTIRLDDFQSWDALTPLYRVTEYEYVLDTDPAEWIINRLSRQVVKDANGNILSEQRLGYDGFAPGSGANALTKGALTLSQTVDTLTTYTVTKTTDTNDGACNGDCSLREAIVAANASPDVNIINIPASGTAYTLTRSGSDDTAANGDLDITNPVIINGGGAISTTIEGGTGWTDRLFHILGAAVEMSGLTIRKGNSPSSSGGGINNNDAGQLTLTNVTIKENTASDSGGIYNKGVLNISNSTISNNVSNGVAGGLRNIGGLVMLTDVTVSGNTAKTEGGGLRSASNGSFSGKMTLVNVTVTNNTADSDADGTGEGGGIYRSSGTIEVRNSLIAGNFDNSAATKHPDCSGSFTTKGNNLIGNNTGCSGFTNGVSGDQVGTAGSPINPLLGALANNGGQTFTHALNPGSPAINTGTNNGCPGVDQRNYNHDATCDIGAFEANAAGNTPTVTLSNTRTMDAAMVYDTYGNVVETRQYDHWGLAGVLPSGGHRLARTIYETTNYTYATSAVDPLGYVTTTQYRYDLGLPTVVTDPNGNTRTTNYDGLGRVTGIIYPGYGSTENMQYFYPTDDMDAKYAIRMDSWDETADVYRSAWTIYDGLGRALQVQGLAEGSGKLLLADTKYNAQGQVWYSGLPRTVTGSGGSLFEPNWSGIPHTTTTYDGAGRVTGTQFADGSTQSTHYNGLRTTFIDANGHQRIQEADWLGHLVKVEEYMTGYGPTPYATTNYTYDIRDQLTQVTDAAGNVTTITYDTLGRKTGMTDPDMGAWAYGYDFFGNLVKQTDARNTTLAFAYDGLNRLVRKQQGSTFLASFTYDTGTNGIGRRTQMTYGGDTACWEYNQLGQVTKETRRFGSTSCSSGGTSYVTTGGYDAFGRVLTQTIPSGETLTFNYNAMGALNSLSGTSAYVTNIDYNDNGAVESTYLNNGVVAQNCYDLDMARLIQIRAYPATSPNATSCTNTAPANPRLNLSFAYDPAGNIKQITDVTRSEVTNYAYDSLDRLTSVGATQNGATLFQRSYDYDQLGNILRAGTWPNAFVGTATNSGTFGAASVGTNNRGRFTAFPLGAISAFTVGTLSPGQQDWKYTNYTYPASGPGAVRPHAVTGLSTGESYSYDANGNMTARVEGGSTYTQTFDVENRLSSVTVNAQTTTFVYDADGALIKKIKPDGTSTLYLGGYEVDLSAGGAVTKKTTYYPAGGAMRVDIVGGTNTVYYMLSDHLGSASVLLKDNGTIETNGEQRYYPFGESRITAADLKTAHLFTGQIDTGLGIYHYGARAYSPKLGRFLSADTIVPNFADPQSLNRYSYVRNSPLKYIDPTGHSYCDSPYADPECEEDNPPPPITIDNENGVCINVWNIGCSETIEWNLEWIEWNISMLPYEIIDRRLANPEYMNEVSLFFTDAAFVTSSAGASVEITATALGLEGGAFGATVGAIAGNMFHQVVTNPIETAFSSTAAVATFIADISSGNTNFSANGNALSIQIGEASATAATLQAAGTVIPIGVIDAGIDGYASAYSHGHPNAPGIFSMFGLNGRTFSFGPLSITLGK